MKKTTPLIALLFLLILFGCQQGSEISESYQDEVCAELIEFTHKAHETWENEDLETYMSYLDKDIVNMYFYNLSMNLEENRQGFKELFDTYSIEDVKFEVLECFADHNYAFVVGYLDQKWISNDKQDTIITDKLRGITVYKKQEEGNWKIFRIIGQPQTPDENKRLSTLYHERNLEDVDALLAEDFFGSYLYQNRAPDTWNRENHKNAIASWPDVKDSVLIQVAENDWVAERFIRTANNNGTEMKAEIMQFKQFRDGKIVKSYEVIGDLK
jgi:ketosteroid isomerase-like protein